MVVEHGQRHEQQGEPWQPVAGDHQRPQQPVQLGQQDVEDERQAVINGVLEKKERKKEENHRKKLQSAKVWNT